MVPTNCVEYKEEDREENHYKQRRRKEKKYLKNLVTEIILNLENRLKGNEYIRSRNQHGNEGTKHPSM